MTGELINPADSKVLWRYEAISSQPIQGPWDQAPDYPNFNKALKSVAISSRQEILDSFFSGH